MTGYHDSVFENTARYSPFGKALQDAALYAQGIGLKAADGAATAAVDVGSAIIVPRPGGTKVVWGYGFPYLEYVPTPPTLVGGAIRSAGITTNQIQQNIIGISDDAIQTILKAQAALGSGVTWVKDHRWSIFLASLALTGGLVHTYNVWMRKYLMECRSNFGPDFTWRHMFSKFLMRHTSRIVGYKNRGIWRNYNHTEVDPTKGTDNGHRSARNHRNLIADSISLMMEMADKTEIVVQKCSNDGLDTEGVHEHVTAVDVNRPETPWPDVILEKPEHCAIKIVDTDYYVTPESWERMLSFACPIAMYTFSPLEVCGSDAEASFTIIDDQVQYTSSGGGSWSHPVWNLTTVGDSFVYPIDISNRVQPFWRKVLSMIGYRTMCKFSVRFYRPHKLCPHRVLCFLTPEVEFGTFTWLPTVMCKRLEHVKYLQSDIAGPSGKKWNRIDSLVNPIAPRVCSYFAAGKCKFTAETCKNGLHRALRDVDINTVPHSSIGEEGSQACVTVPTSMMGTMQCAASPSSYAGMMRDKQTCEQTHFGFRDTVKSVMERNKYETYSTAEVVTATCYMRDWAATHKANGAVSRVTDIMSAPSRPARIYVPPLGDPAQRDVLESSGREITAPLCENPAMVPAKDDLEHAKYAVDKRVTEKMNPHRIELSVQVYLVKNLPKVLFGPDYGQASPASDEELLEHFRKPRQLAELRAIDRTLGGNLQNLDVLIKMVTHCPDEPPDDYYGLVGQQKEGLLTQEELTQLRSLKDYSVGMPEITDAWRSGLSPFIKQEPSMKVGRIISAWADFKFIIELSRYIVVLDRYMREHHSAFYSPGLSPKQIEQQLRDFASKVLNIMTMDFDGFDASISACLHTLVTIIASKLFKQGRERARFIALMSEVISPAGLARFKKHGFRYDPGNGQKSGSASTCFNNTLINIMVQFLAVHIFDITLEPEEILRRLGALFGDDSVFNALYKAMTFKASAALGLSIRLEEEQIDGQGYMTYLQRVYPNIHESPANFCNPKRAVPKLPITMRPLHITDADAAVDRAEAYLVTDPLTPLISDWCHMVRRVHGRTASTAEVRFDRLFKDTSQAARDIIYGSYSHEGSWTNTVDPDEAIMLSAEIMGVSQEDIHALIAQMRAADTVGDLWKLKPLPWSPKSDTFNTDGVLPTSVESGKIGQGKSKTAYPHKDVRKNNSKPNAKAGAQVAGGAQKGPRNPPKGLLPAPQPAVHAVRNNNAPQPRAPGGTPSNGNVLQGGGAQPRSPQGGNQGAAGGRKGNGKAGAQPAPQHNSSGSRHTGGPRRSPPPPGDGGHGAPPAGGDQAVLPVAPCDAAPGVAKAKKAASKKKKNESKAPQAEPVKQD